MKNAFGINKNHPRDMQTNQPFYRYFYKIEKSDRLTKTFFTLNVITEIHTKRKGTLKQLHGNRHQVLKELMELL